MARISTHHHGEQEIYKKVIEAFHSDEAAEAIKEQFKRAAIPAW